MRIKSSVNDSAALRKSGVLLSGAPDKILNVAIVIAFYNNASRDFLILRNSLSKLGVKMDFPIFSSISSIGQ